MQVFSFRRIKLPTNTHLSLQELAVQQGITEQQLKDLSQMALELAKAKGADQAEVWCYNTVGNSIDVRQGELEVLEFNQDSHLGLNLYFSQKKGTVSINDLTESAVRKGIDAACDIARFTEKDEYSGLADRALMAKEFKDLKLDHPSDLSIADMVDMAVLCEAAALEHPQIKQSEGASFYSHRSVSIYTNSHQFMGVNRTTRYSLSNAVIAESEQRMVKDNWYSMARCVGDMEDPSAVGSHAAKRVIKKLKRGKIQSGNYTVVFTPEMSRTVWGHMLAALKGSVLYQKSSFLLDKKEQIILPDFVNIIEDPFIEKGFGSSNYDSDGVATYKRDIVVEGTLKDYFLSSYSARKLAMKPTASAGGIHNIIVGDTGISLQSLLKQVGTGLLVTELMGQGVNLVTGNYSRGASGFWVENGEIQYYVQEITIAGNLTDMLKNLIAIADNIDTRSSIITGSIAIEGMTIAS